MATVINNPGDNGGTGAGMIIGIVVAIIILALLFIYGLPAIRGNGAATNPSANINLTLPTGDNSGGGGGDVTP